MHILRRLSDIEQDAITLYREFPNKDVQQIARELMSPQWYIQNILFKFVNNKVCGEHLLGGSIAHPIQQPRTSSGLSKSRFQTQVQETRDSQIKLKSKG